MKRKMALILAFLLIASTLISPAFALSGGDTAQWSGSTVAFGAADVTDGKTFELTATLNVEPGKYDYFDSCNLSLVYDKTLIDLQGSAGSSILVEDNGYMLSPIEIPSVGYNITVSNLTMVPPSSTGYCCTITVRMKVVDAAKLKDAGGATVALSCFNNDFNVAKDGVTYFYQQNVAGNGKIEMQVSFTPMTVTVSGGGGNTWTITYNTNGGTAIAASSVTRGQSITLPTPTRSGYTFNGWFSDSGFTTAVNSPYTPAANTTLYARWTTNSGGGGGDGGSSTVYRRITFDSNGGSSVDTISVASGRSTTLPTPTRGGYTFDGWYSDSALTNKVSSPYTPAANVTLYARWTGGSSDPDVYTITYNTNGGASVANPSVTPGTAITLPTPVRSGYTFAGWYSDAALTNRVTSPYTPTASVTLYASWTGDGPGDTTTYTVTFDTNGGSSIANATVEIGSPITLPTPTRSGYTFAGWYTDAELQNKVSGSTYTPTAGTTLYAKWTVASTDGSVPQTGVTSNIPVLIGILGALALCAGVVIFSQRRKQREDD